MKYALFILMLFIVLPGFAQQKEDSNIKLTGTPFGFYVKMGNPVETGYEILRKEKGRDFIRIDSYKPVSTAADLYRRMISFASVFPNFGSPNTVFADTIWRQYKEDKSALSEVPYPLMHLSFGSAYLDTSAILGKTYQYKIVFFDPDKVLESKPVVYTPENPEYSKMKLSKVKNVGSSVRLEWETMAINTPPFFELYRKKSAATQGFKKIEVEKGTRTTKVGDSIIFIAIDTTGIKGISYDYFLASVGYLGNTGNHSDTVRLQLGGRQNVPSVYNFRTRSDSNGIRLSWRALLPNPSLRNILVLRSANYDSGYSVLTTLPVKETHYIDRDVEGGRLYYYQLIVEGSANYSIPTPRVSGKFMGKIKLTSPYDLASRSVNGGISLSWKYKDTGRVKGFRVFRSFHPRQGFKFIGEMVQAPSDTSLIQFTDTTVTDAKTTYYYAVAAVSHTSNLSPSSTVVSGTAIKTSIIPAPTGLRSLWLNDTVVSVTWTNMELQEPEVGGYKIYKNNKEVETVTSQHLFDRVAINEFTDTLQPGETNWYWVKAEGMRGRLGSVSLPIHIQAPVDRPLPPGRVKVYKQDKSIVLSWNNALNNRINKYNIYRATNTGETALIGSIAANKNILHFEDDKVKKGELYFYYVTSINNYKIESHQSEEIHIRY